MRIKSNRSFLSTVIAAFQWRILNFSQRRFEMQNLPRLLCLPSDFLGKHVICNGVFERETMEFVASRIDLCNMNSKNQTVFLDIGANIGNHTCFFASRFDKTISAEPSRVVASILQANILLNDLQDRVTILEAAISNHNGSAMHYTSKGDNLGGGSLDDTRRDTVTAVGKEVQVVTGDKAVSQIASKDSIISFVKIDVEGHEYEVIQGLAATLRRDQPVMLFEADAGPSGQNCFDLLRELGYCRFMEIIGDADADRPALVRGIRRIFAGSRSMEVREILAPEPRYYESILALPPKYAHCVDRI